ncbi:MAG: lactate utilization protein C [Betaproteobacteria bacterium]|nr:lactate utilization protein C [Betaproteobacteria bacterium]
MSARDNILARIRANSGRSGITSESELALARSVIAARARGPQPSLARHDPVRHFIEECGRLKTTVAEVTDVSAVPREVARYLAEGSLPGTVVGWHEYAALDWSGAGIAFADRPAQGDDLIGVTGCFCAIGETGTLLLLGAAATPKATALLPETHICVARKSRMAATMEDAFQWLRSEVGEPPRATFFVSGPSRTADIEQTIVIGAHGPYRVHVILVP